MTKKHFIPVLFIVFLLSSCGIIVSSIVAPNTCTICEIKDTWGAIVWSESGPYFSNLETRCKAEAYDRNQSFSGHTCDCHTEKCE